MWFCAKPVQLQLALVLQILAIQQAHSLSYLLCHGNGLFLVYYSTLGLLYPGGLLTNTGMLCFILCNINCSK